VLVLNTFTGEKPELGVSEIAGATGMNRSTVHRLLASLQHHELVQQLPESKKYALGPHILRLAHAAHARVNLRSIATPVMGWLRDKCNETVGLHVPEGEFARVVLDQVESYRPLRRTYTEIGGPPIPIYHGAPGKALLAFYPAEIQEQVLSRPLEPATPHTITDPAELRAELQRIRERGYALSIEERTPEISTVSVPLRNHTGDVVAALSITGPSRRLTENDLVELAPLALEAAARISGQLGYLQDGHGGESERENSHS
jgi:IclR family acetate operon transcriptional repressor